MSTLFVNNLNTASGDTITLPTGKKIRGVDAGSIAGKGNIINVTFGTHNTTGLTTTSTTFVNYTSSNITVTKLRGPGNVAGGSYLLVMGSAWIEYNGTGANNKHLSYSLMRDGTELSGQSYGFGNLYSINAQGYQSSADISFVDPANLNAGNYVYSMCLASNNGGVTVQMGNGSRIGTWQILEIAT
mgnify:CR=1 FL=1|tara:strand:- start:42 stop:599 length:558 start_codon:yes stop_codon:yes gene_type:complete